MDSQPDRERSLRPGRLELSRLTWAFLISLMLHAGGYGVYRLGRTWHVWENLHLPSWLQKKKPDAALVQKKEEEEKQKMSDPGPTLTFVDVNPQVATIEPPKETKFYSDRNSQAANPTADKETGQPKIDGKQTDLIRTEDVPRMEVNRLKPAAQTANTEQVPEHARPATPVPPGDLVMAKPETELRKDNGTAEQSRPRTIREAMMRQNRNMLAGEKMQQEGGTSRRLQFSALDAKATPFGAYDAAFIYAVEQRWFDLLDTMSYDGYRNGRVVLQFHLNSDGRITEMKVVENNVGEMLGLLCQKAVLDPAPYDKWPREMRMLIDKDYREIQLGFLY